MDLDNITKWIVLGTSITAVVGWLWKTARNETAWREKITKSCEKNDKRVDDLWRFRMRRGYAEAISTGLASPRHGPGRDLFLADEVRRAFEPIAADLRRLYVRLVPIRKDDLIEQIEREYGDWLTDEVCTRFKVQDGACLQFAAQVAMEAESDWNGGNN